MIQISFGIWSPEIISFYLWASDWTNLISSVLRHRAARFLCRYFQFDNTYLFKVLYLNRQWALQSPLLMTRYNCKLLFVANNYTETINFTYGIFGTRWYIVRQCFCIMCWLWKLYGHQSNLLMCKHEADLFKQNLPQKMHHQKSWWLCLTMNYWVCKTYVLEISGAGLTKILPRYLFF